MQGGKPPLQGGCILPLLALLLGKLPWLLMEQQLEEGQEGCNFALAEVILHVQPVHSPQTST